MFPALYHTQHSDYTEDLSFWLELAHQEAKPILELGCGTGRVLMAIAHAGYQVFGLDNDSQMLAFLRDNIPGTIKPKVHFFLADMSQFHLARRFGLALLPCNTYSTCSTLHRQSILDGLGRHLQPGGIFAVSLPNPSLFQKFPPQGSSEIEAVYPHPTDSEPVQVSSSWQRTEEYFTIHWHYDHLLPDGHVQRLSTQVQHHLTATKQYLAEFQAAGFEITNLYGDFQKSTYQPNSPYLIILAKWPVR
jgi:SAM-dependent methyltransferase